MNKKKKQWILTGVILAVILIAGGIYTYVTIRDAERISEKDLNSLPSTVLVGHLEEDDCYIKLAEVNTVPDYGDKYKYLRDENGKLVKDEDGEYIREQDPDGDANTNFYAYYNKKDPDSEVIRIHAVPGSPEEAARLEGFTLTETATMDDKSGELGSKQDGDNYTIGFFIESPYSEYSISTTVTTRLTADPPVSEDPEDAEVTREEKARALLETQMTKITPEKQMAPIAKDFWQNFIKDSRWKFLTNGLLVTMEITLFAVLLGIVIGVMVAVVRSTWDQNAENMRPSLGKGLLGVLNGISKAYLTVIRGTPVVVQLMIIYYVIFKGAQNGTLIGALAFGINSGAYVAEIIRGGIMSVDRGQLEAGRSLGFGYVPTMRYIIVPQALKSVLPALANEFIVLLKETSVAGYVAVMDLTKGGETIRGLTYSPFLPLLAVALIYLIVVMFFTWLVGKLERRLRSSDH